VHSSGCDPMGTTGTSDWNARRAIPTVGRTLSRRTARKAFSGHDEPLD